MRSGLEIHEIVQLVRIQDGVGAAGIPLRITSRWPDVAENKTRVTVL